MRRLNVVRHVFAILISLIFIIQTPLQAAAAGDKWSELRSLADNVELYTAGTPLEADAAKIKSALSDLLRLQKQALSDGRIDSAEATALREKFVDTRGILDILRNQIVADPAVVSEVGTVDIDSIQKACNSNSVVGAGNVFAILFSADAPASDVIAAVKDVETIAKDCRYYLQRAYEKMQRDIARLDGAIVAEERHVEELQAAYEKETDPAKKEEARKKLEDAKAKVEQLKQQRQKKVEASNKLNLGKMLVGLLLMAGGAAMMAFSGGTCSALCVSMITTGATITAEAAVNSEKGKDLIGSETVVTGNQRPSVDPTTKPTEAAVNELTNVVELAGMKVLPGTDGGNFRIAVDPVGNVTILMVTPRETIATATIGTTKVAPSDVEKVKSLADVQFSRVESLDIQKDKVSVILSGNVVGNAAPLSLGLFEETTGKNNFLLSVVTK